MTSTTDMTGHPDVAEISDLTEGLLAPARSAEVRRHLDACDLCADVHASLEEIRGLLGDLPGPPRMPDDVAGRLDAALAAEALLDATAPDTEHAQETVPAVAGDTDAPPVSRETTTAADRPSGHARSTTGPGRKGRRNDRRGNRRRVAVLGAVFTAAALGLGSVLVSSLTGGGGNPGSAPHQSTAPDTFSASKLHTQVTDLLAKAGGSRSPSSMGIQGEPDTQTPKILRQPTVPPCVQQGIGRSEAVLATETGTYKGTDAVLVVLPDASDSTRVDAYIMDTACVNHPSSGPAKILLTTTYTRP